MPALSLLPADLLSLQDEIEGYAREAGLDFFPIVFEMVNYQQMNEIAAYGGFPKRYPHWQHGMVYEQISKSYEFGLSKIYEMVINNNPCYAYLLSANSRLEHKMVMAHVYGHADFFKNNMWFAHTNRRMLDEMANHSVRVQRYVDRVGLEAVESFIDACLSIDNLIDVHAVYSERPKVPRAAPGTSDDAAGDRPRVQKLKAKPYMDSYINPQGYIEDQERRLREESEKRRKFPARAERDVLLFLIENAPIPEWQRDLLSIVREESYYYAPQAMTKIMNEGWAVFWHSRILTGKALRSSELLDYADRHAGTLAMSRTQINPYKIGFELFLNIFERWNKGRFGREYEECASESRRRAWDTGAGLGMQKVFEVRRTHNDITFIDTFFTEEFCREHKLFAYEWNPRTERHEISSRGFETVKAKLLQQLTNRGQPVIQVENGNFENRGELLLVHRHDGVDLKADYARETLANVARIWHRPVCLATIVQKDGKLMRHDGRDFTQKEFRYDPTWAMG